MRIAKGIDMLEISVHIMGGNETINPVLFSDENYALLVDTGYPGVTDKLKAAFHLASVPWSKLNTILITHQDLDHIGSLPALLADKFIIGRAGL